MKFGENLKLIRKEKNISQEFLAEKLGVSRQSVSKWETGENYPSMQNIMCLCTIFKCKINQLVHEDLKDINFLDEEIKMSVVKFKKQEQKKMKVISKIGIVISNIFKIVSKIGMVISIILLVMSYICLPNISLNKEEKSVKIYDDLYTYNMEENTLHVYEDNKEVFKTEDINIEVAEETLSLNTNKKLVLATLIFVSLSVTMVFLDMLFSNLSKLFKNIHDLDTPFSLDNVNHINKIALSLIFIVLIPDLFGIIGQLITNIDLGVEIEVTNYFYILLIIAISYIFKYGYEIQLDSKGKMYGDENE